METDEIVAEVRAVRAELDRLYPTAGEFHRFVKTCEKEVADRLVRRQPVRLHVAGKTR